MSSNTKNLINSCKLCSSKKINKKFNIKDRSYYKCKNCGIVFHNKIPVDLNGIYNSELYYVKERQPTEEHFGYNDYIYYRPYLEEHFENIIIELEKYSKKGRLLDIGCALGFFINVAKRRGYEVTGIDISKFAVEYAKSNYNLNVFCGELKDFNFEPDYFDVVVLNDFLEHIINPQVLIKEVYRILKKRGVIVINTPNINSISFQFFRRSWWYIKLAEHLFIYNYKSIKYLLNCSGFEIVKFKRGTKIIDLNLISGWLGYYNKFLQKTFEKLINVMKIGKFKFKIKAGEILVYAKK